MDAVLVATVGAEPQVITLAADLLLRQGPLLHVIVIHTDPLAPPLPMTLSALRTAWTMRHDLPPRIDVAVPVTDVL